MQSRIKFYLNKFGRFLFGAGHPTRQEHEDFIAQAKANRAHYRREFVDDVRGTFRLAEHRIQGKENCEHTITASFNYAEQIQERNLDHLRVAATLAKYSECHCIDLELTHALNEIGLYFGFEELEIWKNLLAEGRLEEAVYLEYGIAAQNGTQHPHLALLSERSTPSNQNESSTLHHPYQREEFIEATPGSPDEDIAGTYLQNLQRGRSIHRQRVRDNNDQFYPEADNEVKTSKSKRRS